MTAKTSILVMAAVLSCIAGGAMAGKQPGGPPSIVMSKDCPAALASFRNQSMRLFFTISADLKVCAYSYCSTSCKKWSARRLTRHRCEKESGLSCNVYDANDDVPEVEGQ